MHVVAHSIVQAQEQLQPLVHGHQVQLVPGLRSSHEQLHHLAQQLLKHPREDGQVRDNARDLWAIPLAPGLVRRAVRLVVWRNPLKFLHLVLHGGAGIEVQVAAPRVVVLITTLAVHLPEVSHERDATWLRTSDVPVHLGAVAGVHQEAGDLRPPVATLQPVHRGAHGAHALGHGLGPACDPPRPPGHHAPHVAHERGDRALQGAGVDGAGEGLQGRGG
mmetsp:Transcript_32616/g.85578  ORF Transcript_32616/g.85578 Transcript_32616/m.85578 type:complete len:219 (-) Transcript_32616:224-880(-)